MRSSWLALAIVAAAAALPYLPALDNYFVQDDFGVVALLSHKPATFFPRWFVIPWMEDIWGYTPDEIRPFPALTYQIASLWGAASPYANHAINIAFHGVNACLVLAIARDAAGLSVGAAAVAGLVFALLPMQTESVAWITGRVDSMPACFFLAAFLTYVRWRRRPRASTYAWTAGLFFIALFSKQNTVIFVPTIVMFDLLVRQQLPALSWAWVRPYVPFAVMTAGYLMLRFVLFGEVARESMLTGQHFAIFSQDLAVHLKRMVYGEPGVAMSATVLAVVVSVGAAIVAAVALTSNRPPGSGPRLGAVAAYFLLVWVALSAAPTLVAGYASPRHMYLTSVGWAIALAVAYEVLWHSRLRPVRAVGLAAALLLLLAYGVQLQAEVRRWDARAMVAQRIVDDIAREAAQVPAGTLVVVGAPRASFDFAIPHAFRPPYTSEDVAARLRVISHSSLHCCPAPVWEPYTRSQVRAWTDDPSRPPAVVLHWNPSTGTLSRVDDSGEPFLRTVMPMLLETPDVASLDARLLDIIDKVAVGRGTVKGG